MSSTPHTPTGHPSVAEPSVGEIRRGLGSLRRRIRTIFALIGGARVLIALAAAVVVFFLADYLLDLPLGVRRFVRLGLLDQPEGLATGLWLPLLVVAAFLAYALTRSRRPGAALVSFIAGGIIGLLAHVAVRALRPLRMSLSDDELALSVEDRFQHLDDRLAASLDFARELRDPQRGESPAMMRKVVDEAVHEVEQLRLSSAASPRRAAGWLSLAGGAVALVGLLALALPESFSLWITRAVELQDVAWPQETTMRAVALAGDGSISAWDPAKPIEVSLGRPLTVYAQAQGEIPDEAFLVDLVAGQSPLPRRMFAVPEREDLFAFEFRDVRRPFAFVLKGNDDEDDTPRYTVEITIPPRVVGIQTTVTYPAYLGGKTETLPGGGVTVPAGSDIRVEFGSDVPVTRARVLIDKQDIEATRVAAVEGSGPDAASGEALPRYSFSLKAEKTLRYRVRVETPEGRTNDIGVDSHEIRVRRDRAPRAEWIYPYGGIETTAKGRLPLLVRATDDHAVEALTVEIRTGEKHTALWKVRARADAGAENARPEDRFIADGDFGRKRVLAYLPLDIEDLTDEEGEPLASTGQVAVRFVAKDSFGQEHEGEWITIDLYGADELERVLSGRRPAVRSAVESLRAEQLTQLAALEDALEFLDADDTPDLLKAIRFGQGRIAQDAHTAIRQLTDLFNAYVYDRMGAPNPNERILAYMDRHHRKTYGLPPAASGDAGAGPNGGAAAEDMNARGDPVFPYALYAEIVQAWRNKAFYDRGMINRMCAVLEDAVQLGAEVAPGARAAALQAQSGKREDVQAALVAQKAVVAALDRLLERMQSWQNLSDVTWTVRRLIEEQRTLRDQVETDVSGGEQPEDD